jgi:hypothetical protein
LNLELFEKLKLLVKTDYFRYHKVDLYKDCPFWQEQGSCLNRACGVETLLSEQEGNLPLEWTSFNLGKLEQQPRNSSSSSSSSSFESSPDFCVLEDELDSEGVYVDLLSNPERFTGYAGDSSTRVWKAIYEENCFTPIPFIDPSRPSFEPGGTGFVDLSSTSSPFSSAGGGLIGGGWGESEKRLVGSLAGPRDPPMSMFDQETCLEKRVFYKVISGLHASISTHICDDYLDLKTGEWKPNLQCFITRIGQHPERLENMYFTYVLLLRALTRSTTNTIGGENSLLKTLKETTTTSSEETEETRNQLKDLLNLAQNCPATFDENSMFSNNNNDQQQQQGGGGEISLKSEFKQHFRNVSLIMDCVGCDKCRLWGKLQITGIGTALKLLFSSSEQEQDGGGDAVVLSRSEVVAFINTLHRLSESLAAVDKFRELWAKRGLEQQQGQNEKQGVSTSPNDKVKVKDEATFPNSRPENTTTTTTTSRTDSGEEEEGTTTTRTSQSYVGNLTTLPLFCAKAIWTKLIDLCEITLGSRTWSSSSSTSSSSRRNGPLTGEL